MNLVRHIKHDESFYIEAREIRVGRYMVQFVAINQLQIS